jgi:hypothetical protein
MTAQRIASIAGRWPASWGLQVEAACSTVAHTPDWLVDALTVVQRFPRTTYEEREELLSIARCIAREHGAVARPEWEGDSLAIRFGRREHDCAGTSGGLRLAHVSSAWGREGTEGAS